MAISNEQEKQDMEDYAAAFGEDMQPTEAPDEFADTATSDVSADEAAPVTVEEAPAEEPVEAPAPEAAPVEAAPAEEMPAEEAAPAEMAAEETAGEGMPAGDEADVPPEDMQRSRSWEGRLRKREAEIAAREAELAAREAALQEAPAEESPAEEMAEEGKAEMVTDLSPEQALQQLRNDFGDEFVNAIVAIAKSTAQSVAGETVGSSTAEALAALKDLQERYENEGNSEHFEYVMDAHPDMMEIGESEAFKQWLSDKPDMQACCEHGSKRAVVKMLSAFKEAQKQADNDEGLDDLTVVQSSGVVIPEKKRGDFEGAWDEF